MSVKSDLMKQIEASVKRKKELAKEILREKTIAHWAAEFFTEVEKVKKLDANGEFTYLAIDKLRNNLRSLDRKIHIVYREGTETIEPQIELHWSSAYISLNNCDPVTVLEASSAFFQRAMESIE